LNRLIKKGEREIRSIRWDAKKKRGWIQVISLRPVNGRFSWSHLGVERRHIEQRKVSRTKKGENPIWKREEGKNCPLKL